MRKQRKSKLVEGIKAGIISGKLVEPFSVNDVNQACLNLLEKSPAFLSKHCAKNPGKYTEFFIRESVGKYFLKKDYL